ncbi:glycoside hydrolase/phage tail family protein [Asticcacaulis sp. BYS171W]|uniref:Glycoside hydrolase/phage tail family protein n=1 Tax=Asticcacaulis aquaticus TaxID=2984212 RepID=A0ABT5HUF0_9CAUL|nr:glycoside hydrolase/phage tail family protein [Asticcacaulis aquaticus]MDC7683669.1 glycoside hydrolase/phage tail family protein [Asticcacaulis aquaticus]
MAQVILSTIGSALGGPVGGFIGSTIGQAIDRTVVNALAPVRQLGSRLDGVRVAAADQGASIKQVYGRGRVAGTILWTARLKENRSTTRASKASPKTESYAYSLSFAVGLCEGPIDGIGRIWADGQLLDQSALAYRLYTGGDNQMPDALIEAVEGSAPAYRGLAYLVFEDLPLATFGNRPPSLSVEVFRRAPGDGLETLIEGVCLIPGAGEFVYATAHNAVLEGLSGARWETQNSADGRPDFLVSLDRFQAQLPNVKRVNLVVSWFGDSLDAAVCQIKPGVEQYDKRTKPLHWSVAGLNRTEAHLISTIDDRPVYGGTPSDQTVVEAIRALKARGYAVTLVPFILMDCEGFPWRGRITSDEDVTTFFTGEWGLNRFVRHLAALGVEAGGVDTVLLGSELRGVTTARLGGSYPAVTQLQASAAEVRTIVGASTQISYAADWSEYFGHQAAGEVHFHLDPLWADANIDFVGIDWYAPLTDWRDGDHLDAEEASSIYDAAYLRSRVRCGEGFDWYYASAEDREAQIRTPIIDSAHGEDWLFRPKDVRSWWANAHHDRPSGVRSATSTAWVPQSKPVRFIEYGCGAIDKGPNAPNLFLDPKSSESAVPPFSTGERDDRAQRSYLTALTEFYGDPSNNPVSTVYGAPMLSGMDVWCWDARPYPAFPQKAEVWGDGDNWHTGHWLNGRVGGASAKHLLSAIAEQAGADLDVSAASGQIDGYVIEQPMRAAQALEPVLSYLGLEIADRNGLTVIADSMAVELSRDDLAFQDRDPVLARRDLMAVPGALILRCYDLDRDYQVQAVHARSDAASGDTLSLDLSLALTAAQARDFAGYTLAQAQGVRESISVDLSPAQILRFEIGDAVAFEGVNYRISGIDLSERPSALLTPVPPSRAVVSGEPSGGGEGIVTPILTGFTLLELPCFGADESNTRPIVVASSSPFMGIDIYAGASESALRLRGQIRQAAGIGETRMALSAGQSGVCLREASLDIYLEGEAPQSRSETDVLGGENFICVRGDEWEIIQYAEVVPLGPRLYRLRGLLRGQWGTRALPVADGAAVVHLPPDFTRAEMSNDELGLPRLWRAGRSGFGGAAEGAIDVEAAWTGLALRPRAPVHGRVRREAEGVSLSWIRCARYGGDHLDLEPPVDEAVEVYRLRFYQGEALRREIEVTESRFVYGDDLRALDYPGGFDAESRLEIVQKSTTSAYGLPLEVRLHGL